jgi:type I restriction enzyme S subunit
MSKYKKYKPCGFDWIGAVPEHWQINRLKNICLTNKEALSEKTSSDYLMEYVDIGNTNDRGEFLDVQEMEFSEAPSRARRKVAGGDTIISTVRTYLRAIAFIEEPKDNLIVSTGFAVLSPIKRIVLSKFLFYQVTCDSFIQRVIANSDGVSYPAISSTKLDNIKLFIPALDEQLAIVEYLDEQTRKIDCLIANKKSQAKKLKELRQIEINNAVTKGLNPNAEMKDSGIDWLGEIPRHWQVKKVKQLLKPQKNAIKTGPFGSDLKFEDLVEQGIKVYNQRSVLDNDWGSGEGYITKEKYKSLDTCTIFPGDIVLTTRGTIGKAAIFPKDAELGILHPCLMRVQMNNQRILNDFLRIIINESGYFLEALKLASNATTIEVVYSDNLKEVKIALPPTDEQEEIIYYVQRRTMSIDKLIKNIETQIDKLQELRKIKIYEAVTGKIKVNAYAEATA